MLLLARRVLRVMQPAVETRASTNLAHTYQGLEVTCQNRPATHSLQDFALKLLLLAPPFPADISSDIPRESETTTLSSRRVRFILTVGALLCSACIVSADVGAVGSMHMKPQALADRDNNRYDCRGALERPR